MGPSMSRNARIKSRAKATILHRILGRGGKSSSKRTRTRSCDIVVAIMQNAKLTIN